MSELLFKYINDVIEAPLSATLDPTGLDEDFAELGQGLIFLAARIADYERRLAEKDAELEQIRGITRALELNNQLLGNITQYVPHKVFVLGNENNEILLMNTMAEEEIKLYPDFLTDILVCLPDRDHTKGHLQYAEVTMLRGNEECYFSVIFYMLAWEGHKAEAFVISDISAEKSLEVQASRDGMTNLYNRQYGMTILTDWVAARRPFALTFFDLDSLKFINDTYGHNEGDRYIVTAANCLKIPVANSVTARIGGDEFMLLIPDADYYTAREYVLNSLKMLQNDSYLHGKDYEYSASYGIVAIDKENTLSAGEVLALADERMYENKRKRKKGR